MSIDVTSISDELAKLRGSEPVADQIIPVYEFNPVPRCEACGHLRDQHASPSPKAPPASRRYGTCLAKADVRPNYADGEGGCVCTAFRLSRASVVTAAGYLANGKTSAACPDVEQHTDGMPAGYIDRADWAEEMAKTHDQQQCPTCGFWVIWVRR